MTRGGAVAGAVLGLALLLAPRAVAGTAPVVRASVEPARVGVGEPLVVRVDVVGGDPDAVRVEIDPGPFTALAAARVERRDDGVRVTQRLACLSLDCASGDRPRDLVLPAARATIGGRSVAGPALRIRVVPRVPAAALERTEPPFRRTTAPAPPDLRVSPDRLAQVLYGIAALLALVAAAFVTSEVRRARVGGGRAPVDPVARALRLVRESAGRSTEDRRRAAGLLARVLAERGATPLADTAGAVAWSAPPPDRSAAEALAGEVERASVARGAAP